MSLKRYLATCYVITLAMLLIAGAMISITDPKVKFIGWLILAPILAALNTFVQIFPFARMVPEQKRFGFWSYRWTSIIFIAFPFFILMLGILGTAIGALTST